MVCVRESSSGSGISRFARGKPGKPSMNGALKVIRSWNTECVFCTCLSTTSCICQATLLRCFCATHEHNFLKTWMGIGRNRMPGRGITCLPCNHRPETKWFWAYSPDISWFKAESNYRYIHPHPPIRQLLFCFKKNVWKLSDLPLNPNQVTISGEGQFWGPKRFVLGDVVISDGTALLRLLYFCQRCDCGILWLCVCTYTSP